MGRSLRIWPSHFHDKRETDDRRAAPPTPRSAFAAYIGPRGRETRAGGGIVSGTLDISYEACASIVRERPIGPSPWIDALPRDHRRNCAAVLALARTLRDVVDAAAGD